MNKAHTIPDTVDIIIPAKNECGAIEDCLAALAKQDYPSSNIKIYVIDNGSSDNTATLVKKYNVQLLSLAQGTIGAARNLGIKAGSSKFVAFLDAHCLPEPDWLKQMIDHLKNSNDAACQGYIQFQFSNFLTKAWTQKYGFISESQQRERCLNGSRTIYPFFVTGNVVCRRDAIETVGLFDETLIRAEDLDLSWKLLLSGYRLGYNPNAKVLHKNDESLPSYFSKYFRTGKSLAHAYKKYELAEENIWSRDTFYQSTSVSQLTYFLLCYAGYQLENIKQKLGLASRPKPFAPSVEATLRPVFFWDQNLFVALSQEIVFWRNSTSDFIVLNIRTGARFVFSDAGTAIFQKITTSSSRESVISALAETYAANRQTIENDTDEFMQTLIHQDIIIVQNQQ